MPTLARDISCVFLTAAVGLAICADSAQAQDYGHDFVTVGNAGNAAFNRVSTDPFQRNSEALGQGSVGYEFRIGRFEITTAQYLEFANAAYSNPNASYRSFMTQVGPSTWGATVTGVGSGIVRFSLRNEPDAGMRPVFGVGWREAALYCNWLHNGKSSSPSAFMTGAYDVSTWGLTSGGVFTDGLTHLPDARFWIPTYSEQLKAFYYDPNRNGPGQGGWWLSTDRSDSLPVSGLPGVGGTSAGIPLPPIGSTAFSPLQIPLGAYGQTSAYGLYDTAGGTAEWSELSLPFGSGEPRDRGLLGPSAGTSSAPSMSSIYEVRGNGPQFSLNYQGFRIATSIPSPGTIVGVGLVLFASTIRRWRST